MAQHFVRVVEDGSLATGDGWAIVRCEDSGDLVFAVERSAAAEAETLSNAWKAAAQLVIEQAVREGHVRYCEPPEDADGPTG